MSDAQRPFESIDNSSAVVLAKAIKDKKVSPLELADHFLKKISLLDSKLNAFVWIDPDAVRANAKKLESQVTNGSSLGAFHGVPLPIKDLAEVAGDPVFLGSHATGDKIGQVDSESIRRLRLCGFNFMGRTNSPEFGTLPVTENQRFGASKNPWNLERTTGGSSGGAAAAVAAGMAPIAHASDGGGSIRIPASCCGLVGLKPSRGRVPKGPLITDVFHGFTTDGCVSTTVEDSAAYLDVVSGSDPTTWYSAPEFKGSYQSACKKPPKKLRIAFSPDSPIEAEVSQDCLLGLQKTTDLLRDLGHEVIEATPPWHAIPGVGPHFMNVWITAAAYLPIKEENWDKTEWHNKGLRDLGKAQNSLTYAQSVMQLQAFSRVVVRAFLDQFDVFLTPTLAIPPPKIGWLFETGTKDPMELLWRSTAMVPSTAWVNATGQPAISLPLHQTPDGLPIGMQFVGAPFREDTLLQLSHQIESAQPWPSVANGLLRP